MDKLSLLTDLDSEWAQKTTLQRIWTPFDVSFKVAKDNIQPFHVSFYYMRYFLHLIFLWPTKPESNQRVYIIINRIIMSILFVFITIITFHIYEAHHDMLRLGDNLVVLIGLYLIYLKFLLFWCRRDQIGAIIDKCDEFHVKFTLECRNTDKQNNNSNNKEESKNNWCNGYGDGDGDGDTEGDVHIASHNKICYWQRLFFIYEILSFPLYSSLALLLWCAIGIQPILSNEPLPFRILLPYDLHDKQKYPTVNICFYAFQMLCTFYVLLAIVLFDSISCHSFAQITLNLKILCLHFRDLGAIDKSESHIYNALRDIVKFHQEIIDLCEDINKCFNINYIAQMGASTFMICLTAFETLLAKDQHMVAFKFVVYMFCAFMQLFYWCFLGNMTYYESSDVGVAAFEVQRWYAYSPKIQRQLMFIIMRAQKPLAFRARPFPSFTFESFKNILSRSYTYFALLRTMSD